eukprot:3508731-Alexandrium_andersonii.AAC.1
MAAIFEQVLGFAHKGSGGVSYLDQFCTMLRKHFDGVKAVHLNSNIWIEGVTRNRVYVCAFTQEMGGQAAATAWGAKVDAIISCRS